MRNPSFFVPSITAFVKFGLVQKAGENTPTAPNASVFSPSQSETSPPIDAPATAVFSRSGSVRYFASTAGFTFSSRNLA